MSRSDLIDLEVEVIHMTERAVLVCSANTGKQAWVPLSMCEVDPIGDGKIHTLTLRESVAIGKELV